MRYSLCGIKRFIPSRPEHQIAQTEYNFIPYGMNLPLYFLVCATIIAFAMISKGKKNALNRKAANNTSVEQKSVRPEKWVQVGKVDKLIIYPIKSCQGVVVDEAVVTTLALKFKNFNIRDRDFMLVDGNGKQQTQSILPSMALISLTVQGNDEITLNAPGMNPCTFTYPKYDPELERFAQVRHDKKVKSLDCGDDVAEWFQIYLGHSDLRLYYHHVNHTQRTLEPYHYKVPQFQQSDMGSFHNETSYLMVAQESIVELNKRLEKESSWKNWRPSILIDNILEPFAEVNWSFVRIGNGILKAAVPCKRCPLTTNDPATGIMSKDGEPLNTLRLMNRADYVVDKDLAELLKSRGIMGLRMGLYLPAGEGAVLKTGHPVYAALL